MEFDRHRVDTLFRVWQPDIEPVDDEPTLSSSVQVHLEFRRRIKYQWKVRSDDGTRERMMGETEGSPVVKALRVDPQVFLCYNASHQIVSDALSSWHINHAQRDKIIDEVMFEGREIGNRVSNMDRKIFPLCVEIVLLLVITCNQRAFIDWLMEDDRTGNGMVPASRSSIKALETVRMEGGDGDQSCSICLEELSVGVQVTRMSCSHVFHGDCIVRWLEKSHYCPICRFKMPTYIFH